MKIWLRVTAPPAVKVKSFECAPCADVGDQGRDMQRLVALARDLDVIERRASSPTDSSSA